MKMNPRKRFGPRPSARSFFWQRGLIAKRRPAVSPPPPQETPEPFLERVWSWLHRTFPERQIYIRSDGRVQFFTFGPSLQATMAGLALIFLGWVAFATVNVVFKDRIIAAKDHRYQQMQSAYENRLADLQISYNDLNGALVEAQDKFKSTADALTAKQNAIAGFLTRRNQVEAAIGGQGPVAPAATAKDAGDAMNISGATIAGDSDDATDSSLAVMPGPVLPQPRVQPPVKAGLLDSSRLYGIWDRIEKFAAGLMSRRGTSADARAVTYTQHPALQMLARQTARVAALDPAETQMMAETETALGGEVGLLRETVKRTGINPDQFLSKAVSDEGIGGPEVPLDKVRLEGASDPGFANAYLRAGAVMEELNALSSEISHIPLVMPVAGAAFDRSSGFGARVDPFTGHYEFHTGVDFAGPWGAAVTATAPGKVVFAGSRGGYGNLVEIDHGFGIHTRYGHLSRITVAVGASVGKGAVVGRVGSTGRSTGPHVHYEVWYDDKVRNPNNFIEAGRHVL